ncbi:hypothetical protein ABBQ38_013278 [Trebouxia sp. C0009 RCD-2024]
MLSQLFSIPQGASCRSAEIQGMAAGHPEMARPAKEAGKLPTPEIPAEFGHKQRPALLAPTTFLKQGGELALKEAGAVSSPNTMAYPNRIRPCLGCCGLSLWAGETAPGDDPGAAIMGAFLTQGDLGPSAMLMGVPVCLLRLLASNHKMNSSMIEVGGELGEADRVEGQLENSRQRRGGSCRLRWSGKKPFPSYWLMPSMLGETQADSQGPLPHDDALVCLQMRASSDAGRSTAAEGAIVSGSARPGATTPSGARMRRTTGGAGTRMRRATGEFTRLMTLSASAAWKALGCLDPANQHSSALAVSVIGRVK